MREDQTLREMLSIAVAPASVLLPIVGILLVTSEWSQRTGMVTFALVPRRGRVVAAKLLASVVLSLVALALCIVVAVIGTAIASPAIENAWALPVGLLGQHVVSLGTGMISGVALGAALLASAPAIVCRSRCRWPGRSPAGWRGSTPSCTGWIRRPRWRR